MTIAMNLGLAVGELTEDWSGDARYFEYSKAADPLGIGLTPAIPIETFAADLHVGGPSRIVPLDLSAALGIDTGPATSPALLANFIRIRPGEKVATAPNASSELYYVIRGAGCSLVNGDAVTWSAGDFVVLPARSRSTHYAEQDTALYWVTDEPLLRYLGVEATTPRFAPTKFAGATAIAELEQVAADRLAGQRSRVSIILANANLPQTRTVTHVLWAMLGVVPAGSEQRPHRHQSVALDLCVGASPGCYTLLGASLDEHGAILHPTRVDWAPGAVFTTPPGMWHAHFNESSEPAWVIPIQDAGLHTYLRSLDIRFARSTFASLAPEPAEFEAGSFPREFPRRCVGELTRPEDLVGAIQDPERVHKHAGHRYAHVVESAPHECEVLPISKVRRNPAIERLDAAGLEVGRSAEGHVRAVQVGMPEAHAECVHLRGVPSEPSAGPAQRVGSHRPGYRRRAPAPPLELANDPGGPPPCRHRSWPATRRRAAAVSRGARLTRCRPSERRRRSGTGPRASPREDATSSPRRGGLCRLRRRRAQRREEWCSAAGAVRRGPLDRQDSTTDARSLIVRRDDDRNERRHGGRRRS
jgi:gentisate 1,2-dioxygenase